MRKKWAAASILCAFAAVGYADQPIALGNFSIISWSPGHANYPVQTAGGPALEFDAPANTTLDEIVQTWASPQNWAGFNALTATLTTNTTYPVNISVGVTDSAGKLVQTTGLQVQPGAGQTFTVYFNNFAVATMSPPINSFVYSNGTVDFAHVTNVLFQMQNVSAAGSTFITNMSLVTNALNGIVDSYGQYSPADWPSKVHADQDIVLAHQTEAASIQPASALWDKYGGWANGPQLQATGRFRTQKVNGRWWFVTPEGHLYYASIMGDPDYSDKNSLVDVPGTLRRQLFTSVPSAGIFGSPPYTWNAGVQGGQLFNFYLSNLYTLDGPAWTANWNSRTLNRLDSWGFNTLGFYLNGAFMTHPTKPYMQLIGSFGQNPTIKLPTGGAVPDPFDPTFATTARQNITAYPNISQWAIDPYCIGLFVDNEIPWEMGWYPVGNPEGYVTPRTVLQMIVTTGATNAKTAFMAQLQQEYGPISSLNAAWGLSLADWNHFLQQPITLPNPLTAAQAADCKVFLASMMDHYYQTIATILHSLFPDTLYLGSRLVAIYTPFPDIAASAAKYADVVSVNYYGSQVDASVFGFSGGLGKPLLISEFAFESPSDSGMFPTPADGIAKSPSQAARASAYTAYVQSVLQNPAFVGFEWLSLMDMPLTGIAGGPNGEAGFVSATDSVYAPLVQAASTINRSIYTTIAAQPAQPPGAQPNELINPPNSGMIDVTQAPYFADKTGAMDSTNAIQRAIEDHVSVANSACNATLAAEIKRSTYLFFPSGTYKVSKTLTWQDASGNYGAYLGFQGENSTGTIIQLVDNAPGFNNPANPLPVIYTANACAPGATGNTAFHDDIWNMTINTGHGNTGAEGISWLGSNVASLRNLTIISGDGRGKAGIDVTRNYGGPDLIKNVSVTGFDYGIWTGIPNGGADWASTTIEHLLIQNQNVAGIELDNTVLSIRDMTSINAVPAVHVDYSYALLTLLDGHFYGGAANRSAIETDPGAGLPNYYLRNIVSNGYQSALSTGTVIPGQTITELTSQPARNLFPSPPASLNLPVQETPDYSDPNLSHWANVKNFGAVNDGYLPAPTDDTRAIQAAIDSGATTVYFPQGFYAISGPLHIRGSVQKLIGYNGAIITMGGYTGTVFIVDSGAPSLVVIENFEFDLNNTFPTIQDNSAGTLVLSDLANITYSNQAGAGPLFLENDLSLIPAAGSIPAFQFNHQTVWARQFDPEGNGVPANTTIPAKVVNNGGTLWILGMKTEGYYTPAILTKAGGQTELSGAIFYNDEFNAASPANPPPGVPVFINQDSQVSLAYETGVVFYKDWPTQIVETRNGVTRTLNSLQNSYIDTVMPLYTGYPSPPVLSTQTVTVAINASTGIVLSATDPNGLSMTYAIAAPPSNGTLSGSPPNLTYTPAPGYLGIDSFTFTASNGFSTSASTSVYIDVTSWYGATWHGSTFRNVRDFGAKGDGTTNDTQAFRNAINQGNASTPVKAPLQIVLYVPPGTYRITDTIVLWESVQMMGDEDQPPTLVLDAHAPGFNNPALKKPVLATASGYNVDFASEQWWLTAANDTATGSANNIFFNQIHNINLSLSAGNPGATGILWNVAQQTSLRKVNITAADAAIGIDISGQQDYINGFVPTGAGGGTIEDVSITGGGIGIRGTGSQFTFRSLHIQNQTSAGVALTVTGSFNFVDLNISGAPVGISMGEGYNVTLLDSSINANQPFITDHSGVFYAENTTRVTTPGSAYVEGGVGFANGVKISTGTVPMTRTTPMMLRSRPALYPANGSIINVHTLGAKGDGVSDDTAILQQAINQYDTVFLPYGHYLVSNTLTLRPTTRIFGEAMAQIQLASNAPGFSDPSHPKPIILAPDNAAAQTVLANFMITPGATGDTGAVLIKWGAGSASGVWDVSGYDTYSSAIHLNLFGHGGGVFSNVWAPGADPGQSGSVAGFLGNSTGPAWFYSVEFEHMPAHAFWLSGASNYYFVTPQTEDTPTAFEVDQSSHVWVYGLIGTHWTVISPLLQFSGSSDLNFQNFYLYHLQDYCLTMPTSPNGACQLASHITPTIIFPTGWSGTSLLQFSPPILSTPNLTSINPAIITAGDPGFTLTLNGTSLLNGCTAYWNGLAMLTNVVGSMPVAASVPASYFVSVGTATVQVVNSDGGASNSLAVTVVPSPQTPNLSGWPAFIPIDGTLNLPAQPGSTYRWTFTPDTVTSASVVRAMGASSGSSASTLTQAPALSLSALALGPGQYSIQVIVINAAGKASPPAQAMITLVTASDDLSGVRVYPNPFRSARGDRQITFDQMPAGGTVKIFTVSGRLVTTLSAPAGIASWPLTNDSGDKAASGIYLYLITDGQGNKTHGELTVIR